MVLAMFTCSRTDTERVSSKPRPADLAHGCFYLSLDLLAKQLHDGELVCTHCHLNAALAVGEVDHTCTQGGTAALKQAHSAHMP